jgi:RNA-splicing ligase RtcB
MIELKGKYGKDCKVFAKTIESAAIGTIQNILDNPVTKDVPVRIMPDTHQGVDIVIGFTMPVTGLINPNHIGVDIGCGMAFVRILNVVSESSFEEIDRTIRNVVPMGFDINSESITESEKQSFFDKANINLSFHREGMFPEPPYVDESYITKLCKKVGMNEKVFYNSIGSLGGGNHFIEIGKDANNCIYLTIHSGSRNFGVKVCKYYAKLAKFDKRAFSSELEEIKKTVPPQRLQEEIKRIKEEFSIRNGYLSDTAMYNYLFDMSIAQTYASLNRQTIINRISHALGWKTSSTIETVHNYINFDDLIIRKGAISAHENEIVVIPMNMADGILLCRGKGNPDWNYSAPHGAGRLFSRSFAKEKLSMETFKERMVEVYSTSVCEGTIDESPMAYKSTDEIKELIEPTVDIIDTIRPLINIKAL